MFIVTRQYIKICNILSTQIHTFDMYSARNTNIKAEGSLKGSKLFNQKNDKYLKTEA